MNCVFDENEKEYHSCARPVCGHTECDKHEEYQHCGYTGLGKVCKPSMNCRDISCPQHPDYHREEARSKAYHMLGEVGKRVRAYKDARKYKEGNRCVHGRLTKVFVRGNSVAYKVDAGNGNTFTCSYIEVTMFQD